MCDVSPQTDRHSIRSSRARKQFFSLLWKSIANLSEPCLFSRSSTYGFSNLSVSTEFQDLFGIRTSSRKKKDKFKFVKPCEKSLRSNHIEKYLKTGNLSFQVLSGFLRGDGPPSGGTTSKSITEKLKPFKLLVILVYCKYLIPNIIHVRMLQVK